MRKVVFKMDEGQIVATWDDFDCLAVSPAGYGNTLTEAFTDLMKKTEPYELNHIVTDIENGIITTEIDIKKEFSEALSLVDGVIEVIEIYKAQSPAQQVWKMNWLFGAHELINKNSEIIDTIDRLLTHTATSDFCSSEWKNDFDKATNIINKIKQAVEDRKQSIIEDRDYPFFNIIEDIINAE